jgi:hypothetical protein
MSVSTYQFYLKTSECKSTVSSTVKYNSITDQNPLRNISFEEGNLGLCRQLDQINSNYRESG